MLSKADVCCVTIHVTIFLYLFGLPSQRIYCFIKVLTMILHSNKTQHGHYVQFELSKLVKVVAVTI